MTATIPPNPNTDRSHPDSLASLGEDCPVAALERGERHIDQLLSSLQGSASDPQQGSATTAETAFENQLALVRLGVATSLFYALRTKHAPTAEHSLRVALSCSAWTERLGLTETVRDRIEVAALLHDIGKIGIPDRILRKPGRLTADEQLVMDCCPQLSAEILRGCTSDQELLNTVQYGNHWYDSRRHEDGPRGDQLPLGSRMLAIADAFDAMTTDSVYRSAMSRERAIGELIQGSGTQFDPELAVDFSRMLEEQPEILHGIVVQRWLSQLRAKSDDRLWSASSWAGAAPATAVASETELFYQQLFAMNNDGVIFTDAEGTIHQWNDRMRSLTSMEPSVIIGKTWSNECVRLRQQEAGPSAELSLVHECLSTGGTIGRPMLIEQPGREPTPVHVVITPVTAPGGAVHGTVIVIRDLSEKANLKKQLKSLHQKTTLDPLTGVANRAHFDAVLAEHTQSATVGKFNFSLIICDIDHFKSVNDVHGHPAGDEALVSFAKVLTAHSREGDLVARYGGEEFLLLAPHCDNATAANRAEAIRRALESTPLPSLGGACVTASFGVTEFQSGDTPESVLARADRALLKAKDNGRNRVIQLGTGNRAAAVPQLNKRGWLSWFDADARGGRGEFDILAPGPCDLAIDKLRGFIADHSAEVISVKESQVSLKLNVLCLRGGRRRMDRRIAVRAELTMSEHQVDGKQPGGRKQTNVHLILEPIRNRDRRSRELSECFNHVLTSLNSYLMGQIRRSELS